VELLFGNGWELEFTRAAAGNLKGRVSGERRIRRDKEFAGTGYLFGCNLINSHIFQV
jgi:hypothetical protein